MKKKKIIYLSGIIVLLIAAAVICCIVLINGKSTFNGNRIKNPDEYILDIELMNGKDTHVMELKENSCLEISFKIEGGTFDLRIIAPDGETVYSGNEKNAVDFSVNIDEGGSYTIEATAKRAKGRVHIKAK